MKMKGENKDLGDMSCCYLFVSRGPLSCVHHNQPNPKNIRTHLFPKPNSQILGPLSQLCLFRGMVSAKCLGWDGPPSGAGMSDTGCLLRRKWGDRENLETFLCSPGWPWNYKITNVFKTYKGMYRPRKTTHPLRAPALLVEDKCSILSTYIYGS